MSQRTENKNDFSVAVTGHQPHLLGGHSQEMMNRLQTIAADWLRTASPGEVVTGLAAGWDLAVAKAALDLGISMVAALAFRNQAENWPEDAKREFDAVLTHAAAVYVDAEEKASGCWTRRDRWVLERGDVVLALWSGEDGGTGRAVKTAEKLGKPVVNLWNEWRQRDRAQFRSPQAFLREDLT